MRIDELIAQPNDMDHMIQRVGVIADICNTMGNKPLMYRQVKGVFHNAYKFVLKVTPDENREINGNQKNPAQQVQHLATLATAAGLKGLVCSPKEITPLRAILPPETQLITPGIRPAGTDTGDQKRVLTPPQAIEAGASWLVIGRPICAAENPRAATEAILDSLAGSAK